MILKVASNGSVPHLDHLGRYFGMSPFLLHIHQLDIHANYPQMTADMSVELLLLTGQC